MTADDKKNPDQSSANAPDDGQSDNNKKQSDGGRGCLLYSIIALVLLPLLYFLSTGPVLVVFLKIGYFPDWIQAVLWTVYYPIIWLAQNNETFGNIAGAYVGWWLNIFKVAFFN